jgi:D-alanine--poly(phosphoribitol) ligase subunit 2
MNGGALSTKASVQQAVSTILTERLGLELPAEDADLFERGILDSLTFVDLLLHLERELGVKCSLEEVELDNFQSIGRIIDFILAQRGVRTEAAA